MPKYQVFFHLGDELGLKTRVLKGHTWLDGSGLHLEGTLGLTIPPEDFKQVKLFRLHGLGRVIQVDYANGRLFLSVVRLMIGQFAFINFFKTGALFEQLASITNNSTT